jgi:hypothetical protein
VRPPDDAGVLDAPADAATDAEETSGPESDPELGSGPECESRAFGELTGEYRGVPAFSNAGSLAACNDGVCVCTGCTTFCCGIKWQCVEYVERFYFTKWPELTAERGLAQQPSVCNLRGSGDAKELLGATQCALQKFKNGESTIPPRRDDIIVWGPSASCPSTNCTANGSACACGHTGIIRDIQYNQVGDVVEVDVIGQNFGRNTCDNARSYAVSRDASSGVYRIATAGSEFVTLGWMGLGGSAPAIVVTTPGSGDTWLQGQAYPITWSATNVVAPLRIVARKAGLEVSPTISTSAGTAGMQSVVVPATWTPGSDYEVCVTANAGTTADCSPSFSVIAPSGCTFMDARLEAAVREQVGVPAGPIPPTSIATLTSLDASNRQIASLSGIGCLSALRTLNVRGNELTDLSPVAALPLRDLIAADNSISSLGALTALPSLRYLDAQNNTITAIPALGGIEDLLLARNNVSDISGVASMPNLHLLNLNFNAISGSLAPLVSSGLASGDALFVQQNPFDCNAQLQHLTALRDRGVLVSADCSGFN